MGSIFSYFSKSTLLVFTCISALLRFSQLPHNIEGASDHGPTSEHKRKTVERQNQTREYLFIMRILTPT